MNKMLVFLLLLSCSNEVVVDKLEECRLECDDENKKSLGVCDDKKAHCEKMNNITREKTPNNLLQDCEGTYRECRDEAKAKAKWMECLKPCQLRWGK